MAMWAYFFKIRCFLIRPNPNGFGFPCGFFSLHQPRFGGTDKKTGSQVCSLGVAGVSCLDKPGSCICGDSVLCLTSQRDLSTQTNGVSIKPTRGDRVLCSGGGRATETKGGLVVQWSSGGLVWCLWLGQQRHLAVSLKYWGGGGPFEHFQASNPPTGSDVPACRFIPPAPVSCLQKSGLVVVFRCFVLTLILKSIMLVRVVFCVRSWLLHCFPVSETRSASFLFWGHHGIAQVVGLAHLVSHELTHAGPLAGAAANSS